MANTTFAITTVMATGQVNHQINLELLARLNAHYCSFEPERQRFAIWRTVRPRGQVNVFTSGKLVMNGYKTEAECREAFAIVVAKIREAKRRQDEMKKEEEKAREAKEAEKAKEAEEAEAREQEAAPDADLMNEMEQAFAEEDDEEEGEDAETRR
tara:strand:- start:326 stop:790 length:465 start_codon:yes stop_codon:yes gene_type:complete